ncbi:MAG: hypothetical protein ACOCRO_01760, partial [Halanaerobiales bacterium]
MNAIKKYLSLILIFSLISIFSFQPILKASEVIPTKKISEIEMIVYGEVSSKSTTDRINNLDKTLFGE